VRFFCQRESVTAARTNLICFVSMLNETDRDRRIVSDVGGQQEAREGKERKGKEREEGGEAH
jgi:hypothetical protein